MELLLSDENFKKEKNILLRVLEENKRKISVYGFRNNGHVVFTIQYTSDNQTSMANKIYDEYLHSFFSIDKEEAEEFFKKKQLEFYGKIIFDDISVSVLYDNKK